MVRIARAEDAPAFAAIYAPFVEETFVSFEDVAPSAEEMAHRVETTLATLPWLAIEEEGRVVAFAYASPHRARPAYRWAVDAAIYVSEGQRGRGLGRELYGALLPLLAELRYTVAYAGIALPNPASVGLHESMGFRRVALYEAVGFKAGRWTDVGWWERPLAPRTVPPEEPIPFPELTKRGLRL